MNEDTALVDRWHTGTLDEWVVDSETTHPDGTETITLRSMPVVTEIHTPEAILATRMEPNDADADTVREFLVALLSELWRWGDGFDSKRPFGTSDWQITLRIALVKGGHVQGRFDEMGYLQECDEDTAQRSIAAAIWSLGRPEEEQ